ncbi:tRNA pseudouridine synthase D (TruD)-like protein [Elsinoe fawcettii]|nr:tRNA pseudouridine synthase D (TruD)-like protein [Elsinoe fawcettii]
MAETDHPRKRLRLDKNGGHGDNAGATASYISQVPVYEVRQKAVEDQLEQERKFGVSSFVFKTPGFTCILKQRFTDFLVNEVDLSGKVAHLEAPQSNKVKESRVDDADSKSAGEQQANGGENEVAKNVTDAAGSEVQAAVKPTEPSAAIPEESLTELQEIFGGKAVEFMQDLYSKILTHPDRKPRDLPQHNSEAIEDKQQRTQAHVAVRKAFNGRIETVTGDDNRIMIKAGAAPRKGYRQLPHKGNGPITKGKVGWDELGGEYLHFTLYKENKDTMEVLYFIASQLKLHVKNFQFAGTKDRRGVTVQRVSAYRITKEKLSSFNPRLRNARMSSFEYRKEPLQLGDLTGNEFVIALRDCQLLHGSAQANLDDAIASTVSAFRENGFINYYGLQRFGTYNVSTDEVGKRMLQGDLKGAVDGLLEFSPDLLDESKGQTAGSKFSQDDMLRAEAIDAWNKTRKTGKAIDKLPRRFQAENAIIRHLGFVDRNSGKQSRTEDWQGALMQIPRNLRLMYVHAYQSLVWNAVAAKRQELYGNKVVEGDLVIITKEENGNGQSAEDVDDEGEVIIRPTGDDTATAVEDKFERARPLTKEDLDSGKYSIFDIVLPQPGYDVEYPKNATGDFFKEFMAKDGLDPNDMRRKWKDISLSGSYRKVMSRPEKVSHELKRYVEEDEQLLLTDMDRLEGKTDLPMHDDSATKTALIITMQLGSSQYATMALRELTKGGALSFKPDYSGR